MARSRMAIIAVGCALMTMWPDNAATAQSSEQPETLRFTANILDQPSRAIAIGFSSLAEARVSSFDVDLDWRQRNEEVLSSLDSDDAAFALYELESGGETAFDQDDVKAVTKIWRAGEDAVEHPGYLLLARESVPSAWVSDLLAAVAEDDRIMRNAGVDPERLVPEAALADLPIPSHPGVEDYLRETGVEPPMMSAVTSQPAAIEEQPSQDTAPDRTGGDIPASAEEAEGQLFSLYFKTDESKLDRDDYKIVAAACQFAATLPSARFVIAGHADRVGTKVYNEALSSRRAEGVAAAIRNDPRFREALSVIEFGETKPAVPTEDGVPEPMNRRVEITILSE